MFGARTAPILWLFLCGLALAAPVFAQKVARLDIGPAYTNKEMYPRVDVIISPHGGQIPTADDLELLEGGRPTGKAVLLRPFSETTYETGLIILLDVSGSMEKGPLQAAVKALDNLIPQFTANDKVALVTFADDSKVEAPFGTASDEMLAILHHLKGRGHKTELLRALVESIELLSQQGAPARRRILVVSDGKDEGTQFTSDDVIHQAKDAGVAVDGIGASRIGTDYFPVIERISVNTGGVFAEGLSDNAMAAALSERIAALRSAPVATFKFTADRPPDGTTQTIGVRWASAGLEGQVPVILPRIDAPVASPKAPAGGSQNLRWVYLAAAALLFIALFLVLRGRRQPTADGEDSLSITNPPGAGMPPPLPGAGMKIRTGPPIDISQAQAAAAGAVQEPAKRKRLKTEWRAPVEAPYEGKTGAVLAIESGPIAGRSFTVEKPVFWIGSGDNNDLSIPDDKAISWNHICFQFENNELFVHDNDSTNGTKVNEFLLERGSRAVVNWDDRVQIGGTVIRVQKPAQYL